ncbi:hypothetical protein UC34_24515 [Pandoraea vervacti]|uniref:ABC transporter substrate-binding protein n=1 Tax=Pandoraea vervacti TaxID=656178 RepID=A0ABN4G1E5_9BURK|nr:DUF2076 domain-containing protein [Pandoraea vervacti]AJP59259.1 hypothetical protein UC34_24515 [Pandoraea vervacti]
MNQQEWQTLQSFLTQLTQAQAGVKDEQAEALIADAVRRQPDAAYLLVQRALLLDQALVSARAQIATLQAQLQATQGGARDGREGFLGGGNTWGNAGNAGSTAGASTGVGCGPGGAGNAGAAVAQASYPTPTPTPAPAPAQPPAPPTAPAQRSGWLGDGARSTLGSIATTAAGVAGGAFLFQGIESLFHRNGGGGFFGQPAMGGIGGVGGIGGMSGLGSGMMPSETIINNTIYEDGNRREDGNGNGNHQLDASDSDISNIDDGPMDTDASDFSNDDSNYL